MKRLGFAIALYAVLIWGAFAQLSGGLMFPGPGTPASAGGGGGPVTLVDSGTAQQSGASVTTFSSTPITITAALTDPAILCLTVFNNDGVTGATMTWNGTSMTAVSGASVISGSGCSPLCGLGQFWILANPTSGAQTLAINWTTATRVNVNCWSFSKVNQATPSAHGTSGTGSSNTGSITVTSASNDLAVGSYVAGDGGTTVSSVTPGGETSLAINNNLFANGSNYKAGAASVALTATFSGSTHWGSIGVDLVHD